MSDAVITVENVSKRYLIGHRSGEKGGYRYTALRDVIGREARNLARKAVDVAIYDGPWPSTLVPRP